MVTLTHGHTESVTTGSGLRLKAVELKKQVHADTPRAQDNRALSPAGRGEGQRKCKRALEKKNQGRLLTAERARMDCPEWVRCEQCREDLWQALSAAYQVPIHVFLVELRFAQISPPSLGSVND